MANKTENSENSVLLPEVKSSSVPNVPVPVGTPFPETRAHLVTCNPAVDSPLIVNGKGVTFTDEDGKQYLNMNDISCVLGYSHPGFTKALIETAATKMLAHAGSYSPEKEELIHNFMEVTHGDFDKIFFAGSGGEVVDWSLKVARRSTGRDGIISFHNALHGRSFAGAYISGTPSRKEGFGSGLEHVYFWDYPGDGRSHEPAAEEIKEIAAIIIEPFQAIGGMVSPSKEYWKWLRNFTKEQGILLILDEIQTGFGKTGNFFSYEELGIVPDILLAGKGMSNGFGMGALLMTKEVGACIKPHEMAGGSADNAFMCSVVNAVFDIYQKDCILEHVCQVGSLIREELTKIIKDMTAKNPYHFNGKVHGKGLFLSLELPEGYAEKVVAKAKAKGVLFGRGGNKVMLRPPLVLTMEEAKKVCEVLRELVSEAELG